MSDTIGQFCLERENRPIGLLHPTLHKSVRMTRKEFSFNGMNRVREHVRASCSAKEIFLRGDIVDIKFGTVLARGGGSFEHLISPSRPDNRTFPAFRSARAIGAADDVCTCNPRVVSNGHSALSVFQNKVN